MAMWNYDEDCVLYHSWIDVCQRADRVDREYFTKLYMNYGPDGVKFPKTGIHTKKQKFDEAFIIFLGIFICALAIFGAGAYITKMAIGGM